MKEILIDGKKHRVSDDVTYSDLAKKYYTGDSKVILVSTNGRLRELYHKAEEDGEVSFVTMEDPAGHMTYRRSLRFLMECAARDLFDEKEPSTVRILFSMDNSYYCEVFTGDKRIDVSDEFCVSLRSSMEDLCRQNLPITKKSVHFRDAIDDFNGMGLKDKAHLFSFRRTSRMNVYTLNGYEDYLYGYMVTDTGELSVFDIQKYEDGFLLVYPKRKVDKEKTSPPNLRPKLFSLSLSATKWASGMDVATIAQVNEKIVDGSMGYMVLAQDAVMEKQIADIAHMIIDSGKKIVLIAGPSSSGKTTFSHRLSIQLYAAGIHPHPIALDDFFIDRDKMVPLPDGSLDFEDIKAVDVDGFNETALKLLSGQEVMMPTYDFVNGKQEFLGNTLKIGRDDIIVAEGIHALNPDFSYRLPDDDKFKIYISALTSLKSDEHTPVSTRDIRLIRRIVRDNRTRGHGPLSTFARWESVRSGEERHIHTRKMQMSCSIHR